jgi:hypothetical protein
LTAKVQLRHKPPHVLDLTRDRSDGTSPAFAGGCSKNLEEKTIMKNIAIAAVLAAVAAVGVLAACGGGTPEPTSPSAGASSSTPADSSSAAPAGSAAPK